MQRAQVVLSYAPDRGEYLDRPAHAPERCQRRRHCKLSHDPFFVDEVRDIAGRHLNPPDRAVILRVDEKSRVQALNRTRAMPPMGVRAQR